jgi:hypothetical protein
VTSPPTSPEAADPTAAALRAAGYRGLFLAGDHSTARAVWRHGENRDALLEIVRSERYDDLERVLASEVLYQNDPAYPPPGSADLLGRVYARALAITGTGDRPIVLTGNEWGFLYHGGGDGALGPHLLAAGKAAVSPLLPLLDDPAPLFYEGSQEAMLGGRLRYRVKDAAAYYLGKLTGVPMPFHESLAERDAEIERFRAAVAG